MKKQVICVAAALVVLGQTAFGGGQAAQPRQGGGASQSSGGKTLIVRAFGDPLSFQPDTIPDDYNFAIVQNIYNRLVKLDASKSIIPDLAKSWETNGDGLRITFHLEQGVRWHDGAPFTSKDVKYTFDVIKANDTYFGYTVLTNVASIETPDDYTVIFNMVKPDVSVIGYLGWYATFILPEHIFNNGQAWGENPASNKPIGTGPFKFVRFTPGVSVELEKNSDYWQSQVQLDRLIFSIIPDSSTAVQAMLNGELDILETAPDSELDLLRAGGITLVSNVYPSPFYIAFNFKGEYETPYAVRKALALCVNREEIANKVFNDVRSPEYNFYPSVVEWASNSRARAPAYSIQEAVKTLEDAGYRKDAAGYYVRGLEIIVYNDGGAPDVATLISAACREAGIELIVRPMEYQAWSQQVWENVNSPTGTFKIALMGGFQGPDPAALQTRVGTRALNNIGQYSNTEIDGLFDRALINSDRGYRQPLYFRVQEILAAELPIIPVVNYATFDAQAANVRMAPVQCAGIAGWAEFSYTYLEN
ncbi:MAG: ABC transporter substrate-binding protein [Treponema sp.]|nr:ABC transporter substrate-binding protein [Treponema sp.]